MPYRIMMQPMRIVLMITVTAFLFTTAYAQDKDKDKWGEGEIQKVEFEIVKERQISLSNANRTFEKIPPRPVDQKAKPDLTYDFKNLAFNVPDFNPAIRPLKLKQEELSKIYGNYVSGGFGNYASPYLEGYLTNKRDKNKFYGVKFYHQSYGKGPVDGKNSSSANTELRLFGRTFNKDISAGGFLNYEKIGTNFYGYSPLTLVDNSTLKQSYGIFSLGGELQNAKPGDYNYNLKAGFSNLSDHYKASENEVSLSYTSTLKISDESKFLLNADYFLMARKDGAVTYNTRNLLKVKPAYQYSPMDELFVTIGANVAYENDTIGKKQSFHIYPNVWANYHLTDGVEAFAALTGDVDRVSLHTLTRENLWVNSNIGVFNTNRNVDFQLGLKGKAGRKVGFGTGVSIANLKDFYYYVNSPADQSKFNTVYDNGNTRRTNFFAEFDYSATQAVKMVVRGDYYGYATDVISQVWKTAPVTGAAPSGRDALQRPTYRVSFTSSYNLYNKLLFNIDMIAQGGIKALDYSQSKVVTLDPAIDLNLKADYLVSKQFSVFVKFNNMLSNNYQVYYNYPVRGFQAMGGVSYSF